MDEELNYAYLLEIPVKSCDVAAKKGKAHRARGSKLKEKVVEKVNREALPDAEQTRIEPAPAWSEPSAPPEVPAGLLGEPMEKTEPVPAFFEETAAETPFSEGVTVLPKREDVIGEESPRAEKSDDLAADIGPILRRGKGSRRGTGTRWYLGAAAVCAAGALLFLLNIFWFDLDLVSLVSGKASAPVKAADNRLSADFTLAMPTMGSVEAREGALVFSSKGGVYASADGVVCAVTENEDGFSVEIAHSDLFRSVISGLDMAFFGVGESVYRAQPVGYSRGSEVTVCFYEKGEIRSDLKIEDGSIVL